MRLCLFTDTLGDVNGVSRFVCAIADQAAAAGRELHAACSTRLEIPQRGNLVNHRPRLAMQMPGYADLEVVWPPGRAMLAWARQRRPEAIHVSTPGPVGLVGRRIARRLGVPLVGTYHTDFPAYLAHLFDDAMLSRGAEAYLRWFYRPFNRVLTRGPGSVAAVERLGVRRERIVPLRPGVDLETFHPRHRDESLWARLGVSEGTKVLYVGRVSVEKGLSTLTRAWKSLPPGGATLVIVGDGPYRALMERDLAGTGTRFLGFRRGQELSAIYASADLFVFPSATDTLGQVAMEARASGLPTLVSDRGGPKDLVCDGRTGLILPAADASAWAAALAHLIADGPARRSMASAARAAVEDHSIAASFEHFWSLHRDIAGC